MREKKLISPNNYCYSTDLQIQISDINYGGHVGNERYLLFAQEARMRFLNTFGYSEINFGPYGIVVAEASIEYFAELFHPDKITVSISLDNIGRSAFDCYYKIERMHHEMYTIVACIKTNMVCYDYKERKVKSIPEDIKQKLIATINSK